jgi:hypothetical protein
MAALNNHFIKINRVVRLRNRASGVKQDHSAWDNQVTHKEAYAHDD